MADAEPTRADRLRLLIALEIARIDRDLKARESFLMVMWSRHRTREPFLDTTFSRWRTLTIGDLATLDAGVIAAVQVFFDELEAFRMYIRYTEDMPITLQERFSKRLARLSTSAATAIEHLGGVPEALHALPLMPIPIPPPAPTDA